MSHHCLIEQRRVGKGERVEEHHWICQVTYGTLALGTEGIGFDAMMRASFFTFSPKLERPSPPRRKSDIENGCLPPELFDAEEAKAFLAQHAHSQSLSERPE